MSGARRPGEEPPDWALPAWDELPGERGPARASRPVGPPDGTPAVPAQMTAHGAPAVRTLTVSEVTRRIREVVRGDPRLADVWVEAEVGRVTISSAGHAYFSLKDERNQLQCVWFRDDRLVSAFEAQAGLRVVAHGRVDLYEPTGALQLYVDSLQPAGHGDLAVRFEELKARLTAEGLFERARKRRLPMRPATIAVVTSPSGAVWHDVCQVLARRWPLARVVLSPCQVQGEAAPSSIVRALARVERWAAAEASAGRPDDAPAVTILARGGGSLEDLWAFNDERVVRAVVAHGLPVVCGVGHETDVTLADFAADVRAPTPSAAAEVVVPDRHEAHAGVMADRRRLDGLATRRLQAARAGVVAERRALERLGPEAQLATARERAGHLLDRATRSLADRVVVDRITIERLTARLRPILPDRLERQQAVLARTGRLLPLLVASRVGAARGALESAAAALAVLGPQATLERGYAIVRRGPDDRIVRDSSEVPAGTALRIRVARGELAATVDGSVPAHDGRHASS